MNTTNQTDKELKRIEAKQTLGLPLTAHETALLALYGTTEQKQTTPRITEHKRFLLSGKIVGANADKIKQRVMAHLNGHKDTLKTNAIKLLDDLKTD